MDIASLTITGFSQGLADRSFSALEVLEATLDRLTRHEAALHAFLARADQSELRQQARHIDEAATGGEALPPLAGVPVAIKDTIVTKGIPTSAGSDILEGYVPAYDATVVERLRGAGALIIGKTNCDEFAMGSSGENSAFGPTANPWDASRVPGGSSSGSAAAVAAGECLASLGSDTGGSIRQPAGFCGVVGLKPTYGRVSRYGLIALASSLDQIGPITRTVEDAARVLKVIAGHDPHDASSVAQPPLDLSAVQAADIRGMRIGVPKEYFVEGMDPAVESTVRACIELLRSRGAAIKNVSLPHTDYALAVYYLLQPAEASANLARYDGIRYGRRVRGRTLEETYGASRDRGFGKEVKRRIMLGTYALSAGYHDAYYVKAQKVRTLIRADFSAVFKDVDALVTPVSPTLPFKLGEKFADPITMYLSDIFTIPANIAGLPGLSVPAGWKGGLPIGLQLMGPLWSEERLLTIGNALEQTLKLPLRYPSPAA